MGRKGETAVGMEGSTLNVQADRLTVAAAERRPFQEYIPVIGEVTPTTSVYLDAMEGGWVEEIFIQPGAMVAQGDRILRLANTNLVSTREYVLRRRRTCFRKRLWL